MKEVIIERWVPRDPKYQNYEVLNIEGPRESWFESLEEEPFKYSPNREGKLAVIYEGSSEYSEDLVFRETIYLKVSLNDYIKKIRRRVEDCLRKSDAATIIEVAAYLGVPLE